MELFATYEIETDDGAVLAYRHTFRGIEYIQQECTGEQIVSLTEIFSSVGVDNVFDLSGEKPSIDARSILNRIISARKHEDLLRVLLQRADGKPIADDEFNTKKGVLFVRLVTEVAMVFFTLNVELIEHITSTLLQFLATSTQAAEHMARLASSISSTSSPTATSRKKQSSAKRR